MSQDERVSVLDYIPLKLGDSGHSIKAVRVFLVNGIKEYIRKNNRCLETGQPINRVSAYSAQMRRR